MSVSCVDFTQMNMTRIQSGVAGAILALSMPVLTAQSLSSLPAVAQKEMQQKLGFMQYLPKSTAFYMSAHGIEKHGEMLMRSQMMKALDEMMTREGGGSITKMFTDPDYKTFMDVAGEEVFMAMGQGSEAQMKLWSDFYYAYTSGSYGAIPYAFFGGLHMNLQVVQKTQMGMFSKILEHKRLGADKLTKFEVPAMIAGFKVSDKERRDELLKVIQGSFKEAVAIQGEGLKMLQAYKGQHSGVELSGFRVDMEATMDAFDQNVAPMLAQGGMNIMEPLALAKVIDAYKKKSIYVTCGEVDDYIVFFVGGDMKGFQLERDSSKSLIANDELSYLKHYIGKDILFHQYLSKGLSEVSLGNTEMMAAMMEGMARALEEDDELFKESEKVVRPMKRFVVNEARLDDLSMRRRQGIVVFKDEDIHLDIIGGNKPDVSLLATKNPLTSLPVRSESTIFSAYWSANADYSKVGMEMMRDVSNALTEGVFMMDKASKLQPDNVKGQKMFTKVVPFTGYFQQMMHTLTGDFAYGIGNHGAIIIDGKGEFPSLPMIPRPIIKDGKLPRVTMVMDISDASRLEKGWAALEKTAEGVLSTISKEHKLELEIPKANVKEVNGATWMSYPIPGVHSNCNPSAVKNDKLLMLTTSPDHAASLLKGKAKIPAKNFQATLNIVAMNEFLAEWVALVDEHGAKVFVGDNAGEDYKKYRKEVRPSLVAMLEAAMHLESLSVTTENRDGEFLGSLTLKMAK